MLTLSNLAYPHYILVTILAAECGKILGMDLREVQKGKVILMGRIIGMGLLLATASWGALPEHPASMPFPSKTRVTQAGVYQVSGIGNELILSGTIDGEVAISCDALCRVTLENATINGKLTIDGEALVWSVGRSTLANAGDSVLSSTGALMLAGEGRVTLAGGGGGKSAAVVRSGDEIEVAGGVWQIQMPSAAEAATCGIAATKKFRIDAGSINIVSECSDFKSTGIYSDKKNVVFAGGVVKVELAGPKSVGVATGDADAAVKLHAGAVTLALAGDGARGVKTDGTFLMTGGLLKATMSGNPLYEAAEYGTGTNLVVATTKTSLLKSGTYLIEDVTAATAVKCGTLDISGGTLRIRTNGAASRGLVAETSLDVSGGVFDIQANGTTSNPVVDLVSDGVLSLVELDRKTACCLRQSATNGVATITGGTFYLVATNYGGKCISTGAALTVGTTGATTLPSDAKFAPDIQCSTFGQKLFVAAQKLDSYRTLGTATPTTDISSAIQLSANASRVVSGSGESVDYTNPKCLKSEMGLTFESGRLRMYSKCDGGEGMESKRNLTVNGGIIEGTCYDDVVQATDTITINGGYLYCGSTGNDGIDANNKIVINGGIVLAFTLTNPEVGIDVDNSRNLAINGGIVLAVGSASNMAYGSSGTQKSYLTTSASLSTYAGKYLKIANTSYYVKIPSASSTSGSCSIMCSAPGCTTSSPSTTTTPSGKDTGFHGVYVAE